MRSRLYRIVLSCLLVLAAAGAAAGEDAKPVLFLEDPWPPYTLGEAGAAPTGGIAAALVTEALKRAGVAVRLELHPWKRCLKMVEAGEADGLMLVIRDPERDGYLTLTDTVFTSREAFYYRPDRLPDFAWETFEDVKPRTIGLVRGFTYTDAFAEAVKSAPLVTEETATSEDNLRKLVNGRVDLIEDDEAVIDALLAERPEWKAAVRQAAKPVAEYQYYLGIAKTSPLLAKLADINRAIASMQADGTMDRLLHRGN